jgi:LysR family transcriptional regulator, transcriptional activator of nhaA
MAADGDDAGLLRALGAKGIGLFPVRADLRSEVEASSEAEWVGCLEGAKESYYAISVERRVRHPAATRMLEAAQSRRPNFE